ncbi:TPA: hypothetical protein HA278_03710 [Candidatus Woesearchaeota archaeon]|nr:hypothetical protein [Candidatus Woesearchaeota archaeon]
MVSGFEVSIQSNLFFNIGLVLIVATIVGYLAKLLKQPLIPAYILAGVLIGPFGLGLIKESDIIIALSEIGIAFLLFIVGLEIDLKKLKEVGLVSTVGGAVQVMAVFIIGFFIARGLGFIYIESIYLGFVFAFSSTMIVIKLLSDKSELNTLHGKIILGILLMQDIIVIFVLVLLQSFGNFDLSFLAWAFLKGAVLLAFAVLLSQFVLPLIFRVSARSQELLFLSSISVCFLFSLVAFSFGFSIVIGAFLAGLALASLPYHFDIAGKIIPLRDFFATLFFVSLGMELVFDSFNGLLWPLIIFLGIVVILKPIIFMLIVSAFGFKKRTGFFTSVSLAQISEFSLVLVALGLTLGHVSNQIFTLTVLLAIVTITLTSYFIHYDGWVYGKISRKLDVFEKLALKDSDLEHLPYHRRKDIVLFGAHRMGRIFIDTLSKMGSNFVVVDFDPQVIRKLIAKRIPCVYGDVANDEVLKRLNLHSIKMVISTVPNDEDNLFLIKYIKKINPKVIMIVTSSHAGTALHLYENGADYVIVPHLLSGEMVSHSLMELIEKKKDIEEVKIRHMRHLRSNEK